MSIHADKCKHTPAMNSNADTGQPARRAYPTSDPISLAQRSRQQRIAYRQRRAADDRMRLLSVIGVIAFVTMSTLTATAVSVPKPTTIVAALLAWIAAILYFTYAFRQRQRRNQIQAETPT